MKYIKNILFVLILTLGFSGCEIDYSDCYTFKVTNEITYVPYRTPYYSVSYYDMCGLTNYTATQEARSNEYTYTYYQGGYYITEKQTCTFWRRW